MYVAGPSSSFTSSLFHEKNRLQLDSLATSDKGFVYDFFPYTGKIARVHTANVPDLKACANSVLQLAESIPSLKKKHVIL